MDPHHNEYVAAVAAMPEHTVSGGTTRLLDGKLVTTYAVGDRIKCRGADRGHLPRSAACP
jgi:hypothetical protein